MTKAIHHTALSGFVLVASLFALAQEPAQQPKQQTVIELGPLTGEGGTPPRMAVPDLVALSSDRETQEAARTIGQVLWDDLNFEREFYMIPRDTYKTIPAALSIRSEEHTSELQSRLHLVCRLLLEKKKTK